MTAMEQIIRENGMDDERARIALWWSGVLLSLPKPSTSGQPPAPADGGIGPDTDV